MEPIPSTTTARATAAIATLYTFPRLLPQAKTYFQNDTIAAIAVIAGVFIGFNLMSGWRISNFDLDIKQVLIMIHSGVGLVVFTLMIVRWWWRKKNNLYTPPNWWKRPPVLAWRVFRVRLLSY